MHERRKDLGGFSGSEGMAPRCVHLAYIYAHTHSIPELDRIEESCSMKAFKIDPIHETSEELNPVPNKQTYSYSYSQ